jgi:hypothetical protein
MASLLIRGLADLERKLRLMQRYYIGQRVHQGLEGETPDEQAGSTDREPIRLEGYSWQRHCHGLIKLPTAA